MGDEHDAQRHAQGKSAIGRKTGIDHGSVSGIRWLVSPEQMPLPSDADPDAIMQGLVCICARMQPWRDHAVAALSQGHGQGDCVRPHGEHDDATERHPPCDRHRRSRRGAIVDFYTRTLGLRLVKKTVNFDDPGTYHLYYGDEQGQPGTILTFFPWEHAAAGRLGVGQTQETLFRVPEGAIGYWTHRFLEHGVTHQGPAKRFGETVLPFKDPDGMHLALVGRARRRERAGLERRRRSGRACDPRLPRRQPAAGGRGADGGDPDRRAGLRGDRARRCAHALRGERTRPWAASSTSAVAGGFPAGRMGAGSVHHIAFRAADDAAQAAMVEKLARDHGIQTTEQKDRNYFRSVYFREPGGILFEIATDDPGFAADEPRGIARAGAEAAAGSWRRTAARSRRVLPALA